MFPTIQPATMWTSGANGHIVADATLTEHHQHQQLKPMQTAAATGGGRGGGGERGRGGPPPLPVRKPPHIPRRLVEPAAATVNPMSRDVSLRVPSAFEQCLELAKVLISPHGLAMKKVTLEGFTIPIALRLLDRRQQQHQQQGIGGFYSSSETAPASAGSDELSITWLEQDTFGFDVRRLTSIRRGEDVEDADDGSSGERWGVVGGTRSKRGGKGLCSGEYRGSQRDEKESLAVVLSWRRGGGPAEVVLQAASRRQRDLVAVTLEMVLSGLRVTEETGANDEDTSAAARADEAISRDGVQLREQQRELGPSSGSSSGELQQAAGLPPNDHYTTSDSTPGVENEDPQAAKEESSPATELVSAGDGKAAAAAAAAAVVAAAADDDTRPASADGGGGGIRQFAKNIAASSPPAVIRRQGRRTINSKRGASTSAPPTRRPHPGSASFGPGGGSGGATNRVPSRSLTRSRTMASSLGRESLAEQQRRIEEEDEHARKRRQDAMARLLLVYDRAKDESVAAAWRLGVRNSY